MKPNHASLVVGILIAVFGHSTHAQAPRSTLKPERRAGWKTGREFHVFRAGRRMAVGQPGGVGITTPDGLTQIFPPAPPSPLMEPANIFRDPSAHAVLTHRGIGAGNSAYATFDQMEQNLVTSMMRNAQMRNNVAPSSSVRVGGAAANPTKIINVAPVYPEAACRANVAGVVILEVTVAPDGTVSNARILRSIPLLDQPALDAVRQWRFEPTLLNGTAVQAILTVTVQFPPG